MGQGSGGTIPEVANNRINPLTQWSMDWMLAAGYSKETFVSSTPPIHLIKIILKSTVDESLIALGHLPLSKLLIETASRFECLREKHDASDRVVKAMNPAYRPLHALAVFLTCLLFLPTKLEKSPEESPRERTPVSWTTAMRGMSMSIGSKFFKLFRTGSLRHSVSE